MVHLPIRPPSLPTDVRRRHRFHHRFAAGVEVRRTYLPRARGSKALRSAKAPVTQELRLHPLYEDVLAILLDPVALLVLLVLVLNCAPGDAMGAVFFTVLILGGVEGLLVDLLSVLGKVVLDVVRKLRDLLVGHLASFGSLG